MRSPGAGKDVGGCRKKVERGHGRSIGIRVDEEGRLQGQVH